MNYVDNIKPASPKLTAKRSKTNSKRVFFKWFLTILILGMVTSFLETKAYAATYYVDATTGSDSDTGLTEDLAWQTLSKVNGESFDPGDSILFKKGETWSGGLTISSSGTSGNLITYGSYGTGADPIIDRTGVNYAVALSAKSYIRIEGLRVQNATSGQFFLSNGSNIEIDSITTSGGVRGIFIFNDADNISVSNSTLTNHTSDGVSTSTGTQTNLTFNTIVFTDTVRGIYLTGSPDTVVINSSTFSGLSSYGIEVALNKTVTNLNINNSSFNSGSTGIYSRGTITGMTIDDSFFNSNSGSGINLAAGTGMTVSNVTINNTEIDDNGAHGIIFGGTGGSHSNVSISNSTISNNTYGFYVTNTIDNVDIADTTVNGNSSEGVYFYMDTGTAATDIDITDTVANNNGSNGFSFHGVGLSDDAVLTRVTASNNDNDGINIKQGWTNVNVYNCTVESNGVDGVGADGDGISYHNTTTGVVKYCNAYNNLKTAVAHVGDSDVNMSYNIFRHDTNGTLALVYVEGTGTYTFYNNVIYSAAQTGTGLQLNTGTTSTVKNNIIYGFDTGFYNNGGSVTADYNLIYNTGTNSWMGLSQGSNSPSDDPLFSDASANDFRLTGSSPAINIGTSVGESQDYGGITVPQGGAPDMGAYEYYTADPTITSSPSNPTRNTTPTIRGTASTISPQTVSSVTYSVDDGSWVSTGLTADDGAFDESTELYTIIFPTELSEGSHTVRIRVTDSNGVVTLSTAYVSDSFVVDTVPPHKFRIGINTTDKYEAGEKSYTVTERNIKLYFKAREDTTKVTRVKVSEDDEFGDVDWEKYDGNLRHKLSKGDGKKTLYIRFKDDAGNKSETYEQIVWLNTSGENQTTLQNIGTITYEPSLYKKYYYTAPFVSFSGKALSNSEIKLLVDGVKISTYNVSDGSDTWSISTNLSNTSHDIEIISNGANSGTSFTLVIDPTGQSFPPSLQKVLGLSDADDSSKPKDTSNNTNEEPPEENRTNNTIIEDTKTTEETPKGLLNWIKGLFSK